MANDKTAAFSIPVQSNAAQVGAEGAAALEQLRQKIAGSTNAIQQMNATMRSLRGPSDEVKSAKEKLAAAIESEKSAISTANLQLLKAGSSYSQLAAQTKEAEKAHAKFQQELEKKALEDQKKELESIRHGLEQTDNPIASLTAKWESLTGALSSSAGVAALTMGAILALGAAILTVTAGLVGLAAAAARWIVEGANMNRTLELQREAWTGSAKNAIALGHQIDALATKVPIAKEKLNELAGATVKALNNTRVSGQGIVDTFNAVAQASAAMGDEVGSTLAEIIKAGKMSGRVAITAPQLQGTGLKIQDVAGELAKTMHVSVAEAVQALAQGRVKVDDAAAAIRKAVEKRFGEINARRMLDLNVIVQKLHESFTSLTKDVKLEPLLEGFKQLADLFSLSTVSGKVLHDTITTIGNKLGPAFKAIVPIARAAFLEIEIGALKIGIAVLKARDAIKEAFKGHEDIITTAKAIELVKTFIDGLAAAAVYTVKVLATGFILASKVFFVLEDAVTKVKETLSGGWKDVGTAIVDGLTGGLFSKLTALQGAGTSLAGALKEAFTSALGIHSPSKVFEGYGANTAEGYQRGLEGAAPGAAAAAEQLAPAPPATGGGGGGGSRGGPISVTIELNVAAGAQPQATAKAVQGVLPELVAALRDVLTSAGVPVGAEVTT